MSLADRQPTPAAVAVAQSCTRSGPPLLTKGKKMSLYDNIRKRRASGKKMRKPGEPGAPTAKAFKDAAKTAKKPKKKKPAKKK